MHGIEEAEDILDELLRGERWALNSSDSRIQHPLLFDTFGERLENAVRLLREAQAPGELVSEVERLRWHESTGKAGQKLGNRRWENNQPVSAAAELSQVSDMLASAKASLQPFADSARSRLAAPRPKSIRIGKRSGRGCSRIANRTHKAWLRRHSVMKSQIKQHNWLSCRPSKKPLHSRLPISAMHWSITPMRRIFSRRKTSQRSRSGRRNRSRRSCATANRFIDAACG